MVTPSGNEMERTKKTERNVLRTVYTRNVKNVSEAVFELA